MCQNFKEADLIASEDTRNTQKLLNHFEIATPQKAYMNTIIKNGATADRTAANGQDYCPMQ